MLSFEQYFLRESPDVVFKGSDKLAWSDLDTIAFGWIKIIPGIEPFFIQSRVKEAFTHTTTCESFFEIFSLTFKNIKKNNPQFINNGTYFLHELLRLYKTEYRHHFKTVPDIQELATTIINNNKAIKFLASGKAMKYLQRSIKASPTSDVSCVKLAMDANLAYGVRQNVLQNAGRIWIQRKVLSFWLTMDQINNNLVDKTFDLLKISPEKRKGYFIDVIDPRNIEKEETENKVIPTYRQFKSRTSNTKAISDEEAKKTAEFIAKQHGVAGALKKQFADRELPEVGAKKYGLQNPLDIRQQAMTSENLVQHLT